MSLIHTASIPSLLSVLLLSACVPKDPDSLETGNDDGASESSDDGASESSDDGATSDPSATSSGSEGGSETGEPDAVCEQIVGTRFSSIEELECGLTPDGPALCHWSIVFEENGDYLWQYSDVGQGGTYTCEGGVITVENDPDLEVSYDLEAGILTWDGVQYVAEPA